jgi:peptide deformylase
MKIDNKYLRQVIPEISFSNTMANLTLANLLVKFMQQSRAIGLAANQVGYQKRLFVMQVDNKIFHCFNPEIVDFRQDIVNNAEGCLSFPKDILKVDRFSEILVKYANYRGEYSTEELSGLAARCFQHELDHLNGITMHQRIKENTHVSSES